jgi:hypothetical protein
MKTTTTIQSLAQEAADAFEVAQRADGTHYYRLRDDIRDSWINELVREAHGDLLPDDHRYRFILRSLEAIAEDEDPEDSDYFPEPDIYTHDLLEWLGSHLSRTGYVDEMRDEFGAETFNGILGEIAAGQQREMMEVYGIVLQFLQMRLA